MRNQQTLRSIDIPSIHKFYVGFDHMFDELMRVSNQSQTNYPPYNILKITENTFQIELAVAGFGEGEISVNLEKRVLTVKGQRNTEQTGEYIHCGISRRNFVREFTIGEHVEVIDARVKDGILVVYLERKIPEELMPKTIAISFDK